jgi:hypothetical protein
MNKSLRVLLSIFLFAPIFATCASNAVDTTNPELAVTAFQQLPPYEMFCQDKTWRSAEPIKVGAKFESYLSKEFYKLFFWSQCGEPKLPPGYSGMNNIFYWDIRFGFKNAGLTNRVKNTRIRPAEYQGSDKAIVKVLFDPVGFPLKNITTIYTLIREDVHWKIDDIAPKGDWVEEGDQEPFFEHSNSIKTDMQNNFRAAEKRYQQEQAKKNAVSKP